MYNPLKGYSPFKALSKVFTPEPMTHREKLTAIVEGVAGATGLGALLYACRTAPRKKEPGVAFLEVEVGPVTSEPKHDKDNVRPLEKKGQDWRSADYTAFYDITIRETNSVGVEIVGRSMMAPNWNDHYSGIVLKKYLREGTRIEGNSEKTFKDCWYWDIDPSSWVNIKYIGKDDNGNKVKTPSFKVKMP